MTYLLQKHIKSATIIMNKQLPELVTWLTREIFMESNWLGMFSNCFRLLKKTLFLHKMVWKWIKQHYKIFLMYMYLCGLGFQLCNFLDRDNTRLVWRNWLKVNVSKSFLVAKFNFFEEINNLNSTRLFLLGKVCPVKLTHKCLVSTKKSHVKQTCSWSCRFS